MDRHFVILAAGKGTRMKARRAKVLHPLAGLPVIAHVLRTARQLGAATTCVVVGHQADDVKAALTDTEGLTFVVQEPQLGTGHALLQTASVLGTRQGTVVLLSGDVPLLRASTLERLIAHHEQARAAATVLTAHVADPHGYGRIIRQDGAIARIVEQRDASADEREVTEINTGIYAFDLAPLFESLRSIATGTARASTTCRTWWRSTGVAASRSRR